MKNKVIISLVLFLILSCKNKEVDLVAKQKVIIKSKYSSWQTTLPKSIYLNNLNSNQTNCILISAKYGHFNYKFEKHPEVVIINCPEDLSGTRLQKYNFNDSEIYFDSLKNIMIEISIFPKGWEDTIPNIDQITEFVNNQNRENKTKGYDAISNTLTYDVDNNDTYTSYYKQSNFSAFPYVFMSKIKTFKNKTIFFGITIKDKNIEELIMKYEDIEISYK